MDGGCSSSLEGAARRSLICYQTPLTSMPLSVSFLVFCIISGVACGALQAAVRCPGLTYVGLTYVDLTYVGENIYCKLMQFT